MTGVPPGPLRPTRRCRSRTGWLECLRRRVDATSGPSTEDDDEESAAASLPSDRAQTCPHQMTLPAPHHGDSMRVAKSPQCSPGIYGGRTIVVRCSSVGSNKGRSVIHESSLESGFRGRWYECPVDGRRMCRTRAGRLSRSAAAQYLGDLGDPSGRPDCPAARP
jgi:hypothetical protein